MKKLLFAALLTGAALRANATIFQYDLTGTAGSGLRPGNEPGSCMGGTGGEIGSGITFDDVAMTLAVNVGWGSSQGFTDLSSIASASHIHGPTAANNGSGFTQTAGVLFTLTRSSSAVSGGTFTTAPIALSAAQVTDLNNGKYYINLHTANNGGGETRGFIVPVPEPSSLALAGMAVAGVAGRVWMRRSKKA